MPFLGNKPTNNFTSFEKQDITGDGSTAYTLAHAVNNEKDIDLYINHVHQEPTTAYSASGTTLTLTESISSSDDCYVLFRSRAILSATPPDGSVNSAKLATDIAISGDLTVDTSTLKVGSSNNRVGIGTASPTHSLTIVNSDYQQLALSGARPTILLKETDGSANENFQLRVDGGSFLIQQQNDAQQNAVTKMSIDQAGHVTMPKQPAFSVTKSAHQLNYSGTSTVTFNTEIFDQNSDFTNNTFTAPVTGRYQLSYNLYLDGISNAANWLESKLVTSNRSYYLTIDPDSLGNVYWNMNMSLLVEMDANDTAYVQIAVQSSSNHDDDINMTSTFHGFLAC